jgi:hypothetical protein
VFAVTMTASSENAVRPAAMGCGPGCACAS